MDMCDGFPTELIRAVNRFRTNPKSVAKYMCDPAYRRDEDPVTKDEVVALFRTFKGGIPPLAETPEMREMSRICCARSSELPVSHTGDLSGMAVSCGYNGHTVGEMYWVGECIPAVADAIVRDWLLDIGWAGRPHREGLLNPDFTSGGGCVSPAHSGGYVVFFHLGSYGQKWYTAPEKLPIGYCVVQKKEQSIERPNSIIDIASSDETDHVSDPPAKRGRPCGDDRIVELTPKNTDIDLLHYGSLDFNAPDSRRVSVGEICQNAQKADAGETGGGLCDIGSGNGRGGEYIISKGSATSRWDVFGEDYILSVGEEPPHLADMRRISSMGSVETYRSRGDTSSGAIEDGISGKHAPDAECVFGADSTPSFGEVSSISGRCTIATSERVERAPDPERLHAGEVPGSANRGPRDIAEILKREGVISVACSPPAVFAPSVVGAIPDLGESPECDESPSSFVRRIWGKILRSSEEGSGFFSRGLQMTDFSMRESEFIRGNMPLLRLYEEENTGYIYPTSMRSHRGALKAIMSTLRDGGQLGASMANLRNLFPDIWNRIEEMLQTLREGDAKWPTWVPIPTELRGRILALRKMRPFHSTKAVFSAVL